jgi:hypothetical protein
MTYVIVTFNLLHFDIIKICSKIEEAYYYV